MPSGYRTCNPRVSLKPKVCESMMVFFNIVVGLRVDTPPESKVILKILLFSMMSVSLSVMIRVPQLLCGNGGLAWSYPCALHILFW
jgi:hypothetical protein